MKFQPDKSDTPIITAHGIGWVQVGSIVNGEIAQERIAHSVVIGSRGERLNWPGIHFDALHPSHFEQIAQLKPELVILGGGTRLRWPAAAMQRALIQRGIGLETMDTPAACRTYNILAGEGRHVLALLLTDPS